MEGVRGSVRLSRGKRLPVPATLQEEHADTGDAEEQIDPPGLDQESERESGGYHEERGAIDAAGSLEREEQPGQTSYKKEQVGSAQPKDTVQHVSQWGNVRQDVRHFERQDPVALP